MRVVNGQKEVRQRWGYFNLEVRDGKGKEGCQIPEEWESGDCLASCMLMTWF